MNTIPVSSSITLPREEWPDADFDIPEDIPIHDADSDKEEGSDMDWDAEMDLGKPSGTKPIVQGLTTISESSKGTSFINIRPPLPSTDSNEDDDDDEGVSTIKVTALPIPRNNPVPNPLIINEDDDLEDAFSLPSDMTQLSLRPLSLHHQSSKGSLEWGDKDQTSSSQSSDTYSSLGLHDGSASSNYTSASLPETETEEEDEDLDGLVIPSGLFETGSRKLNKILQMKKNLFPNDKAKVDIPNAEDDFEIGLVIGDDADFSPSRLLQAAQQSKRIGTLTSRSKSAPSRPPTSLGGPSRLKGDRAKSPANPPPSSMRQFRTLALAANQPRTPTYSEALSATPSPSTSSLLNKTGSLRGQKSHLGLGPTPLPSQKRLGRKASLPSLADPDQAEASGSAPVSGSIAASRYEAPTASSRAKTQSNNLGRVSGPDNAIPPTRPTTPSSNTAALRLTMPTNSSRLKTRTPVSSVFPNKPPSRSNSPLLQRPPSASSLRLRRSPSVGLPPSAKVLKKPKRQRTYGDGTELDGFDDLPLNGEKECQFRVQPKGLRVPGGSCCKEVNKPTLRKKSKREQPTSSPEPKPAPSTNTLRRKGRLDTTSKLIEDEPVKKKNTTPPSSKKKPHLIRNIGSSSTPKIVGEMKWNPQTLRWEGNDQALRDFEAAVGTSTRPALITHLTASSLGSPVGSFASGPRVVGNMIFDPAQMCWISTLSPEDDEPDVFADLADDEEDCDGWVRKGGTLRANQAAESIAPSETSESASSSRMETPSPARSRRGSPSDSGSDRGSRASLVYDVDECFTAMCRQAEERHRAELKNWKFKQADLFDLPDRSHLWEIRALATRRY